MTKYLFQTLIFLLFCSTAPYSFAQSTTTESNPADDQPVVMGIFPRRDPALTMHLFTPLKNYLEQKTGRKLILETTANFEAFEKKLTRRHYDLVHFNQYHYVKSHDKLAYDVIAQNEELGEADIRGAIFVRKDSGIDSIAQLRNKEIVFGGGKDAMMSYIVPRYLLALEGLHQKDFISHFASSPPNSILATFTRQADAGGAGEIASRLPVVTRKIDTSELKILKISEGMAQLPWAVKREMDPTLKQQIKSLLLSLKDSKAGKAILKSAQLTGFNAASDEDYNLHRTIIDKVEADSTEVK
jgi:phosphonate transport system substrate-binding protein